MSEFRDYVTVYLAAQFLTAMVTDLEYKLLGISDSIMTLQRESSNAVNKILDDEESALQAIDVDFDEAGLDAKSLEKATKSIKERQSIEEKFEKMVEKVMRDTQLKEKFEQQQQTKTETELEDERATLQTFKEKLQTLNCGYMGNK